MSCLISSRFNMKATILRQWDYGSPVSDATFEGKQDPWTLEIISEWDQDTSKVESGIQTIEFACIARGIEDGGIRVVGTTDDIKNDGKLVSSDYVRMQFGPNIILTKRDRVTNIKDSSGNIIWKEEEFDGSPTVFNVMGVKPVVDPFGSHIENSALLQRADPQNG